MILFLDMDGVLCTGRVAIANGEQGWIASLDPVALRFLDRMCAAHDIKVVISSVWRIHKRDRRHFYELFAAAGCTYLANSIHPFWRTPSLASGIRGAEINKWRADNASTEDYLILDDSQDFHPEQMSRLIRTDPENGMTMMNFERFERIVSGEQIRHIVTADERAPEPT